MNFFTVIVNGTILVCAILIYFIIRDSKNSDLFFGRNRKLSAIITVLLIFISGTAFYSRYIEPFRINTKIQKIDSIKIDKEINIVFIADPQVNLFKNDNWVKKISAKVEKLNPDFVIFGGDLIDNEGFSDQDEVNYLVPFETITTKFPNYYVLGNHEYGVGNASRKNPNLWTGNRSEDVKKMMTKIGSKPLINQLDCPTIREQQICFFGIDDLWGGKINFNELINWNKNTPLIFITHNPDGILFWPKEIKKPDLVLSGHTHGGQIFLPFLGPLGNAGISLNKKYYRGLNDYMGTPIYTSIGLGESGGPIRFMSVPEISIISLSP